ALSPGGRWLLPLDAARLPASHAAARERTAGGTPDDMRCPRCGTQSPNVAGTCLKCGRVLRATTAQQAGGGDLPRLAVALAAGQARPHWSARREADGWLVSVYPETAGLVGHDALYNWWVSEGGDSIQNADERAATLTPELPRRYRQVAEQPPATSPPPPVATP